MFLNRRFAITLCLMLCLTACADNPPSSLSNICTIFKDKRDWFKAALATQRKWGIPLQIPMAVMYQESRFRYNALPPRHYILGLIPWGRVSSSYGFSQAEKGTWHHYIQQTGHTGAKRNDFADSMDFIGWYLAQAHRFNGIPTTDAYDLYLAYHEGMLGYQRKTYLQKPWLLGVARKVQSRAARYAEQYQSCEQSLKKPQGFLEHLFGL